MKKLYKYAVITITAILIFLNTAAFGSLVNGVTPLEELKSAKGKLLSIISSKSKYGHSHKAIFLSENSKIELSFSFDKPQIMELTKSQKEFKFYWDENWFYGNVLKKVDLEGKQIIRYRLERIKKFYNFFKVIPVISVFWVILLFFYFRKYRSNN